MIAVGRVMVLVPMCVCVSVFYSKLLACLIPTLGITKMVLGQFATMSAKQIDGCVMVNNTPDVHVTKTG